jgi:hypothetical protein
MQLFVKVIPLRAGTTESAGEPRLVCCPPDVEPDTILSFLTQQLGEVIETAWITTSDHTRLPIGWIFPGTPAEEPREAIEVACVPFTESPGGSLQPLFEAQTDQRQQFSQLADNHDQHVTTSRGPHRTYHPDAQQAGPAGDLDHAMAGIARQTGATLRVHPRPGASVRRTVLRDDHDNRGTRYLAATLESDGTLRITGHDQGPRVSDFWGGAITSYEWTYLVASGQIPAFIRLLGGHDGDDVLALLSACYQRAEPDLSEIMNHPDVQADFSNWHS